MRKMGKQYGWTGKFLGNPLKMLKNLGLDCRVTWNSQFCIQGLSRNTITNWKVALTLSVDPFWCYFRKKLKHVCMMSFFQQELYELAIPWFERILLVLEHDQSYFDGEKKLLKRRDELMTLGKYYLWSAFWCIYKISLQKRLYDLAATFYGKVVENLGDNACMEGEDEQRRVELVKLGKIASVVTWKDSNLLDLGS